MTDTALRFGPALVIVTVLLTLAGALVVRYGGLTRGRTVILAAARAAVQLAAVSAIIAAVLRSLPLTWCFIALMGTVAAITSAHRVGSWSAVPWTALALGAGVVPVLALILGSGVLPARPLAVVPMAGILIGGTMTATSQAGRRALDELGTRRGEYEAALALGFTPRASALEICLPSAHQALIPAVDQTRTVGLVALPGAYVGLLLGGASPAQAGMTQLLVLIGLLAAEAVAVLVTVHLVAAGSIAR